MPQNSSVFGNFFSELKNEILGDSIFVFTPKGDVKELPSGSNAIDFAYSIHTGIGEKIVGAKADGKIIALTAPLKNTQIIEIITNPNAHPTQSQLLAVKTSKAHQRIHAWLSENDPTFIDRDAEQKKESANAALARQRELKRPSDKKRKSAEKKDPDSRYSGKIRVENDSNFVVTVARCCCPVPGDPIVGYISSKRARRKPPTASARKRSRRMIRSENPLSISASVS